jgi:hypothetical protein
MSLNAQDASSLEKKLASLDSLIFERAFNNCDTVLIPGIIPEDFEFYHDQSGLTDSRKAFLQSFGSLCNLDYKPIRKLVEGSVKVYPLYNNGRLYAALQEGIHEFYAVEGDKAPYLTSTARFMHLWEWNEDKWMLKRVLSYDHQSPD